MQPTVHVSSILSSEHWFLYRFLFCLVIFYYIYICIYFCFLPRNIYIYKNMYVLNRFETNCGKSMIPFHALWGLCWYIYFFFQLSKCQGIGLLWNATERWCLPLRSCESKLWSSRKTPNKTIVFFSFFQDTKQYVMHDYVTLHIILYESKWFNPILSKNRLFVGFKLLPESRDVFLGLSNPGNWRSSVSPCQPLKQTL